MLVRVMSWQMNDPLFMAVSCYDDELETVKAIGERKGHPAPIHEGTVARLPSQRLEDCEAEP